MESYLFYIGSDLYFKKTTPVAIMTVDLRGARMEDGRASSMKVRDSSEGEVVSSILRK